MNESHNRFCEKFECPYYLSSKSKIWYLENNSISDKIKIGQTKRSWFDPNLMQHFLGWEFGFGFGQARLSHNASMSLLFLFYLLCWSKESSQMISLWQNYRDHFSINWCDDCNFGASVRLWVQFGTLLSGVVSIV